MSDSFDCQEEKKGKRKKGGGRCRVVAFIVYADSAAEGWQDRLAAMHVRGFISPLHDADVLADGTLKKAHWHVILFFDGKKSVAQIDAIREACLGEDFNRHLEDVACAGAYARYLVHMDDPEKAQYRREDVIALGGADYDLASSMPGDDAVVMAEISAYVVAADVTSINALISVCKAQGRRDWLGYISRRGYVVGMMIGHNVKRLERVRSGVVLPGDVLDLGGGAAADSF